MASVAAGVVGGNGSSSSWMQFRGRRERKQNKVNRVKICCSSYSSSAVMDPYKTLRIQPGASESEVRKAFRQLALQVCSSIIFCFPSFIVIDLFLFSFKYLIELIFGFCLSDFE